MKALRCPFVLALVLLAALPATAELAKYKDWSKSPEYVYLATDDEKNAWKAISTDEQAEKFLALFWARRNPDLKNPANEFKQNFEARVAKSDEVFALGTKRGALTERGKALILIGPPKSVSQKQDTEAGQGFGGTRMGNDTANVIYEFLYEEPQLPKWANLKKLSVKFRVDPGTKTETLVDVGATRRLESTAAEKALVHPELKEAPVYKLRAEAEAEAKAASEAAAEAAKGPVLTPAIRKALEDSFTAGQKEGLSLLPLDYANGATRLMVQLFVPAAKAASPDAKLAILVRGKDGKDAVRKEEAAALQKTKGDFFADRVLTVPPGEYEVAMGLFDAAGAPLLVCHGTTQVVEFPTAFSSSPLLVAYNDYEAPTAKPDDPFVFFQRKFVSKGGLKLDAKTDGLAWVVRLYNPTVDAQHKITIKKTITVIRKNGQKIDVPQGAPESIAVPEAKVPDQKGIVLDLAGGVVETDLGDYFDPEDTLRVVITDMGSTAEPKPKVENSAAFAIDKPVKAAPAPAPKKK